MGDKKRKKLSVPRFIATANESLAEPRGSLRFRIVRVGDDDENAEPEEVTSNEVRTSVGKYRLEECIETTQEWVTIGECLQEGETTGRIDRDAALARETARLNDGWAIQNMAIARDRDEWKQLWKEGQKQLESVRAELKETDQELLKLTMEQSEAGAEWVDLIKMGIDRLTFSNFMVEVRKRLNRLAPGMTKDQALMIQGILNSPEFQLSDEDLQAARALEGGSEAEPAAH
jgi:hypothetical protein